MSFYEFRRQLEYKSTYNHRWIEYVDRGYPSSKKCSQCGEIKPNLTLAERTYECEHCHCVLDRDYNAALNLFSYLKEKIGQVLPEFTPADLMALQVDLSLNRLVTSKVETGIQQKSNL
ncbi:transposase [Glaesserella parasuis]|uniref:transposase n=1 Tax=Glaesserella parasuis TaxID=738 RepID=UPI002436F80F|nr:transposase [Glaesserella parasuis]MDG6449002.1 transposase [Glaesserella parasuis]MDG6474727.1 transposase [Glaesserella parasuis]MDG6476914.1 transposase [Glaesserella parasuis]MDO9799646.1 transposase [Glaesserella parasuis]MDO9851016.1 transposase [Glaesserella parasuis]